MEREADMLKRLDSKHCVKLIEAKLAELTIIGNNLNHIFQHDNYWPIIVLEYAKNGDLFSLINPKPFTENQCRFLARSLLQALFTTHNNRIVHNDIKPDNVLIDKNYNIILSDYGLAHMIDSLEEEKCCGTLGYQSPEVVAGRVGEPSADVFAFGVTVFNLLTGRRPFKSAECGDRLYRMIRNKQYVLFWGEQMRMNPEVEFTDGFKRMMNLVWRVEKGERPTVDKLLENEWINGSSVSGEEMREELRRRRKEKIVVEPELLPKDNIFLEILLEGNSEE